MRLRFLPLLAVCIGLGAAFCAPPARAGLDVSFGAAVKIDDDTEVYLAVNSRYYDRDDRDVRRWHRQCRHQDDLAVALFIAHHGNCSPDDVLVLRSQGLAWWEIALRRGVRPDVWFVPVEGDPGPPYGNAYGRWKKHGKRGAERIALSDAEARDLVAVRLLSNYYGVSARVAMEWRSSGGELRRITAGEYRKRHGRAAKVAVQSDGEPGPGQAGNKGKAKGKKK